MGQTMKNFPYSRCFATNAILLLTASLCLVACSRTPAFLKRPNMTALSPRLQALFDTTRTVCFGRFILDIPATATLVYGPAMEDGGDIDFYPGQASKIAQHVTEQLSEVEKDIEFLNKSDLADFPMIGKVSEGTVPGQKLVFGFKDRVSYSVDSFIPLGEDLFVQRAVSAIYKDETIASLNKAAANLRLRPENEVPAEPGMCIDGGFLPLQSDFEYVTLGVRLKEFPDVHFSVEVRKNQSYMIDQGDFERRLKDAEKDAPHGIGSWYSRITFLRRGPRELGQWKGSEALAHKPAQEKGSDAHEFHFNSVGAPNDPLHPQLDIQLDTGVKDDSTASIKPSLTDEEAVALWDKLAGSIRVRPTSANAGTAETPTTPLGQRVATADTMPRAMLLATPNLWERLTGQRPAYPGAAVWELAVEHDLLPPSVAPVAPAEATHTPPSGGI